MLFSFRCHRSDPPKTRPSIFRHFRLPDLDCHLHDDLKGDVPLKGDKQLHHYQKQGVQFLDARKKCILADDVGLGKTLQSITAFKYQKDQGQAKRMLVVCPSQVLENWKEEIQENFEGLNPIIVLNTGKNKIANFRSVAQNKNYDVIIMPESVLSSGDTKTKTAFDQIVESVDTIVIDEAHSIKNSSSNRTKTARRELQKVKNAYMLTATPMPNGLDDIITLAGHIDENLERRLKIDKERFLDVETIRGWNPEKGRSETKTILHGFKNLRELKTIIDGFMLSRNAEGRIKLPELRTHNITVDMEGRQLEFYKDLQADAQAAVARAKRERTDIKMDTILTKIMRMEMCAISPEVVFWNDDVDPESQDIPEEYRVGMTPKIQTAVNAVNEHFQKSDKGVIIFANYKGAIYLLKKYISEHCGIPEDQIGIVAGSTWQKRPDGSWVKKSLSGDKKHQIAKEFNQGKYKVLIGTTAMATGMNLQENCDMCIQMHSYWNPLYPHQQIGRFHRQGSKSDVNHVVNILSSDKGVGVSADSYKHEKLAQKKTLMDAIRDGDSYVRNYNTLTDTEVLEVLGMKKEDIEQYTLERERERLERARMFNQRQAARVLARMTKLKEKLRNTKPSTEAYKTAKESLDELTEEWEAFEPEYRKWAKEHYKEFMKGYRILFPLRKVLVRYPVFRIGGRHYTFNYRR